MRNHDNHNHVIAHLLKASAAIYISVFLAACGDDSSKTSGGSVEDQEVIAISDKTVSGVSQKGPFVNGSSVTVQELDGKILAQTGISYEGKIKNDMGEFSVKVAKLASQYALLKANGFYRNEVSGEKSKSQVTLYALTDLSNRNEVNVNLLTHLEYERSLYLASVDSMPVADAKKQAEKEVLASFGIDGNFANSEDLSIFGKGDENAALLAISILMQGDLSEADFSERLADYAADIETDGKWDDTKTAAEIADWGAAKSLGQSLSYIRTKITDWGLSAEVPAFEKYVDNYWWQNYGLGTCEEKREGEVLQNQNSVSQNYGVFFICDNKAWRLATDIEMDTYSWLDSVNKDADVKWGSVNTNICYVFEDKVWRNGDESDCSLGLRGCTALKQDSVGVGSDKVWHICDAKKWRDATNSEKDTYGWKDTTDGIIMKGNVSDNLYIFDVSKWRLASEADIELDRCSDTNLGIEHTLGKTTFICEKSDEFYGWSEFGLSEKMCAYDVDVVTSTHYDVIYIDDSRGDVFRKPPMDFDVQTEAFAGELVPVYIIGGIDLNNDLDKYYSIDYRLFEHAKGSGYALDYNHRVMKVYFKDTNGEMQLLSQNETRTIDNSGVDTVYVTVSENNIEGKQSAFSIGVCNKISITFKVQSND